MSGVTVTHIDPATDWEGVYVDGEMKAQNHSLDAYDILEAVNGYEVAEVERITTFHLKDGQQFPQSLEDLSDAEYDCCDTPNVSTGYNEDDVYIRDCGNCGYVWYRGDD